MELENDETYPFSKLNGLHARGVRVRMGSKLYLYEFVPLRCYGNSSTMSAKKTPVKEAKAVIDNYHEIHHPLDFSFKTLSTFSGKRVTIIIY